MSIGTNTRRRRVGEHRTPQREQTPEPSLTNKISNAVKSAGKSIKEVVSPTPQPEQLSPEEEGEQRIRERLAKTHSYKTNPKSTPPPLYNEEDAEQKMREKLAGGGPVSEPEPLRRLTASERREKKIQEREEKRRAWAESAANANNKKLLNINEESVKSRIKEFAKDAAGDASRIIKGNPTKPHTKPEPIDPEEESDDGEKIKLYGNGDFRVDQHGMLYRKGSKPGKWISTGKKSKYGIPKEVSDDDVEDKEYSLGSGGMGSLGSSSSSGKMGGLSGGMGGLSSRGKEPSGALSAPTGTISSGVLGTKKASGSGFDEKEEHDRLKSFDAQGSSMRVDSSFIRAGSYKRGTGYDEEKAKDRLDEIDQAGSPMSANMGYISAGTYRAKPQPETGKLDLQGSDIYSTGQFKMNYGTKKPKVIEPQDQIDAEMAKLTALQTRQAQIQQLQQIQAMQQSLQANAPVTTIPLSTPPTNDPETLPANAMEYLFGVKFNSQVQRPKPQAPPQKELSATAQLFGSQSRGSNSQKQSTGNATADFFGLKFGNTPTPKQEPIVMGEFGKKKHRKHSKPHVDIAVYTPKNKLPETKGGFMGLFEKTKKEKTPNQQKKVKPIASEFLFGGRK